MAGGEENSSVDMGQMVQHFDRIRRSSGAHVMVVHHSGKDQARGARGHSLLRAATDTEIEIGDRQITVTKQRDLDMSFASAFELRVVELGRDEDGDAITSCTVDLVRRDELTPKTATPTEQLVLDALEDMLSERSFARALELVEELRKTEPDTTVNGVRGHLKNLLKKGLVKKPVHDQWQLAGPKLSSATWFENTRSSAAPRKHVADGGGRSVFE
jgi:hypothetical protein